jgi:hypothetical protein
MIQVLATPKDCATGHTKGNESNKILLYYITYSKNFLEYFFKYYINFPERGIFYSSALHRIVATRGLAMAHCFVLFCFAKLGCSSWSLGLLVPWALGPLGS